MKLRRGRQGKKLIDAWAGEELTSDVSEAEADFPCPASEAAVPAG